MAPRPDLSLRNEKIIKLMTLASRQLRVGMSVVGFDWTVVEMLAGRDGVATPIDWWELFALGEQEWITQLNKPKPKDGE